MELVQDISRWLSAATILLLYLLFCGYCFARAVRRNKTQQLTSDWLVAYASQSGNAQRIAEQTQERLSLSGLSAQTCALSQLPITQLNQQQNILFVVSTYGEGEAPDNGQRFLKQLRRSKTKLHLNYAILGLGDRQYQEFCAFAHQLNTQLQRLQAQPFLALHEVDGLNNQALKQWQQQLTQRLDLTASAIEQTENWQQIKLISKQQLNPQSQSNGLFLLTFASQASWQAGDILQIQPMNNPEQKLRDYSIASANGEPLQIIVRQQNQGLCSTWLCQQLTEASSINVQIRSNSNFRTVDPHTPAIFIGAGSGIAGLRGHIQQRQTGKNWLIFGERDAQTDVILHDELQSWLNTEQLTHVDLAFSRHPQQAAYVQDKLFEYKQRLLDWIEQGAVIYVCGRLSGMGEGVQQALQKILGQAQLEQLIAQNRYKRDLY